MREWTFGQKLGTCFAFVVTLAILLAGVAVYALRAVVDTQTAVIEVNAQRMVDAETLGWLAESKANAARGYLLTGNAQYETEMADARGELRTVLARLHDSRETDEGRRLVEVLDKAEESHQQALDEVVRLRRTNTSFDTVVGRFETEVIPRRREMNAAVGAFVERERELLERAERESAGRAETAIGWLVGLGLAIAAAAALAGGLLTRGLSRQIGTAVGQVQSSSTELQAAATQQATGARQQATAMSEISTTITELLATARQINDSAQRVAQVAADTAGAAHAGDATVSEAQESIAAMRRQIDVVVQQALDLGRKSQQIGAVLDLVSELAEQTNILAINATIEAAGAGEAGRRFTVVADEIRKLADRVTGSTKEIRALVDELRGAVNATVMATEGGSKAVDQGSRQFGQVAAAFRQIAGLVATTTEAAREIELSTKQQTSAVEQVNQAIGSLADASRETAASSGQTLQTASQLATLSRDLLRLVRPQTADARA